MISEFADRPRTQWDEAATPHNSEKTMKENTSTKIGTHSTRSSFNPKLAFLLVVGIVLAGIGCVEAATHREPIRNGLKEIARDVAYLKECHQRLKGEVPTTDGVGITDLSEQSISDCILTNLIVWSNMILGVFMMAYVVMTLVNCKFLGVREFFTIDDSREPSVTDIAVSWFHNMLDGTQPMVNWNPTMSFFIVIAVVLSSIGGSNASVQMDNLPINMGINKIAEDVPSFKSIPPMDNKLTIMDTELVDEYDINPRQDFVLPPDFRNFLADYENSLHWVGTIALASIISSTIALVLGFMYSRMLCSRNEFPQKYNKPNRKVAQESTKS